MLRAGPELVLLTRGLATRVVLPRGDREGVFIQDMEVFEDFYALFVCDTLGVPGVVLRPYTAADVGLHRAAIIQATGVGLGPRWWGWGHARRLISVAGVAAPPRLRAHGHCQPRL